MKQIIPFKKELLFKTKINEITSISLEHTLSLKKDDEITGEFIIAGDYKMTTSSINREKFKFNIPFDIELNSKYDKDSITIDIDNFYYEIINNESLKINIDVYIEGNEIVEELTTDNLEEITPDIIKKEVPKEIIIDPPQEEYSKKIINESRNEEHENNDDTPNKDNNTDITNIKKDNNETTSNNDFNIFENIDNSDTYVTYHIYIVKEEDTIDKIMEHFGVTKEDISLYNNLENIKKGTKLIIPSTNE